MEEIIFKNKLLEDMKEIDYKYHNTIYLDCEVMRETSVLFCRQLRKLGNQELAKPENERKPIKIYISSYGGILTDYFSMASTMLMYEEKGVIIETYNMGYSCSAGAYLLMLGTKGHRYSTRYGEILVHQIQCGQPYGTQTDMKVRMNNIEKNWDVLKDIMSKYTKMTKEDIENLTKLNIDIIYDPIEALDKGIIDVIL